ncbi:MAG TPA: alpha/beta fold hydrolase [Thermoleophilaceae bacterium]|nr:alpha/beta fold hydrolase [Thermoleophilaceae bacterium]
MTAPNQLSWHRGGSGEPLVLLHGGAGTWRLWEPIIPLLEAHHDVLALTLAGHWGGASLPASGSAGIDALVDQAERDMEAQGFDTAHLAGGSLGAWVALELARRGRARSVVGIAPAGGWRRGSVDWLLLEWMYRAFRVGARLLARRPYAVAGRPRLRRLLLWHHFARPERMHPDYCAHMITGVARCSGLDDFIAWSRQNGGARDLERIRSPVLLAFPEHDRVLPRRRYGERIVDAIEHAEAVNLPGVGHVAMSDDPALVARTIIGFTSRHRAR